MDASKLNSFIDSATKALSCGPECQRVKTQDALMQQYLNAQTNVTTAPHQLDEASRKYHTFKGDYDEYREKELTIKANAITDKYKTKLTGELRRAKLQKDIYDNLDMNYTNVHDLYSKYKRDNDHLFRKLTRTNDNTLTNDRKTFYEDQKIDHLDYYYTILRIIYVIVAIFVAVYTFIRFRLSIRFVSTVVLLIVYPFVSTILLSSLISMIHTNI